jgi:hypothetical protein
MVWFMLLRRSGLRAGMEATMAGASLKAVLG